MITYILLIVLLVVRIFAQFVDYSSLGVVIAVGYFIALICVIGQTKWALPWIFGTVVFSLIVSPVIHSQPYILLFDFSLLILVVMELYLEEHQIIKYIRNSEQFGWRLPLERFLVI